MKLPIYIVDAFTDKQFGGNSAAVVILDAWLPEQQMLRIAAENNLSETAFLLPLAQNSDEIAYEIRWFSPITEIDFCGHATLASAHVIFYQMKFNGTIRFVTREVGELSVNQLPDGQIEMQFPNQQPRPIDEIPSALLEGLSIAPAEVLVNRQAYFVIYDEAQSVVAVQYDAEQLKKLAPLDVVVSAKQEALDLGFTDPAIDFVSRYFWPANGGDEDPVTGSIHSGLAPYWANRLNKNALVAYQASKRGGILYCLVTDSNVVISGHAVSYMSGYIELQ